MEVFTSSTIQCTSECMCVLRLSGLRSSACLWTSVPVCLGLWSSKSLIMNTHRYIPLLSSAGLIHKDQAIPQDLPQVLTNLLSYVFVTSGHKQLIVLFRSNSGLPLCPPWQSVLSFFSVASELTFRHLGVFPIAGQRLCISGESVCGVLGLSVAAGDAIGPGAGAFTSHGQAFLEAL